MMEKIKVRCPFCSKILLVPDNPANFGKKLTCPVCHQTNLFDNFERVKEVAPREEKTELPTSFRGASIANFYLIENAGQSTQRVFELKEGLNTIGRTPMSGPPLASIPISTEDRGLSRLHFNLEIIKASDGRWHSYISNASNKNPTFVNDEQLYDGDKIAIKKGDVIKSSSSMFLFDIREITNEDETIL